MKKASLILALTLLTGFGSIYAKSVDSDGKKEKPKKEKAEKAEEQHYIKAIRMFNTEDGKCTFEVGKIPNKTNIESKAFFAQTHVDAYEKVAHAAPRKQYVVTLKGKLKFKVSNGDTFIIEPGTILIAEDTKGPGHTWDLVKGDKWERLYIPLTDEGSDQFIKD